MVNQQFKLVYTVYGTVAASRQLLYLRVFDSSFRSDKAGHSTGCCGYGEFPLANTFKRLSKIIPIDTYLVFLCLINVNKIEKNNGKNFCILADSNPRHSESKPRALTTILRAPLYNVPQTGYINARTRMRAAC